MNIGTKAIAEKLCENSSKCNLRGLSFQVTPAILYYMRELSKTVFLSVKIEPETKQALEAEAARRNVKLSALVRRVLEASLKYRLDEEDIVREVKTVAPTLGAYSITLEKEFKRFLQHHRDATQGEVRAAYEKGLRDGLSRDRARAAGE